MLIIETEKNKINSKNWVKSWSENPNKVKMNCMSVQEKRSSYEQRSQAYHNNSNTTSRVGLRSCLRGGEIEDTESKRNFCCLSEGS